MSQLLIDKKSMSSQFKNAKVVSGIIVLLVIGSGLFYWYELRPAKIRHDCSWTKVTDPAKPAVPAITREDVENSKIKYNECLVKNNLVSYKERENPYEGLFSGSLTIDQLNERVATDNNFNACKRLLEQEREAVSAKPETYWYREAKKTEYDYCLHEHGL